jgi:hypothetical protein
MYPEYNHLLFLNFLRLATSPGYPGGIPSILAMMVRGDNGYSGGVTLQQVSILCWRSAKYNDGTAPR